MLYSLKAALIFMLVASQAFAAVGEIGVIQTERSEPSFKWRAKNDSYRYFRFASETIAEH